MHFQQGGYYLIFWTLSAGLTFFSEALIFFTATFANILHTEDAFKTFASAANVNAYIFTFLVWWMIMVTAYMELQVAQVNGLSDTAKNFYKFAFLILSSQGI